MANSHSVTIDMTSCRPASASQYDTTKPQLMREMLSEMGGGPRRTTAKADIMPPVGVGTGQHSPMLAPRPRGGVGASNSTDPHNLVTNVGGVEMTLAQAQQLGLAGFGPGGQLQPSQAFVEAKLEEGEAQNAAAEAEVMAIADKETFDWLNSADAACTAAGMSSGLDDLVHAAMHAETKEELINLFSAISPNPEETAIEFGHLVESWTEGLAAAMGLDVKQVDDLLDHAVEHHGLGAVVGRALAGAHRRSYAPILAMLKSKIA